MSAILSSPLIEQLEFLSIVIDRDAVPSIRAAADPLAHLRAIMMVGELLDDDVEALRPIAGDRG